jgi:hypothetical protein
MFGIKKKRKFGKENYYLSSIDRTLDAEPIQEHSARDWRKVGYKARVVKSKKGVLLYLKPEPKLKCLK